jgi:hypothetical protein
MSVYISAEVWARCKQSGHRLLFMLALADYCNDDGVCWPSQDTLAKRLRCTDRGVQKMLAALIADGELILLEAGNGRGNTAEYSLPRYLRKGERRSERANGVPEKGERRSAAIIDKPLDKPSKEPSTLFVISSDTLPPPLNTPEVQDAWDEWQEHCRQKGKRLTEISARRLIKKLQSWGSERAIAAINYSIEKNWGGVFEETGTAKQPPKRKTDWSTVTPENALRIKK